MMNTVENNIPITLKDSCLRPHFIHEETGLRNMADLPKANNGRADNLFRVILEPIQRLSPLDHM